jgi:hypothetical protein
MRQYEQDWLELGFRVAKAMHYQTRWARTGGRCPAGMSSARDRASSGQR